MIVFWAAVLQAGSAWPAIQCGLVVWAFQGRLCAGVLLVKNHDLGIVSRTMTEQTLAILHGAYELIT